MTKSASPSRPTTMVAVTTMEEVPVLDEAERTALLATLEEAKARISRGESIEYNPQEFKERLMRIYRGDLD